MRAQMYPCCNSWGKREVIRGNTPVWVICPACNGTGVVYGRRGYGLSIPYERRGIVEE